MKKLNLAQLLLPCILLITSSFVAKEFGNMKTSIQEKAKSEILQDSANAHKTIKKVLTKAEQSEFTPDLVIKSLQEGNKKFITNNLTARDHSEMIRDASLGQHPKGVILSCMDSRVPVEDVFDKGIGDLFIVRVAGIVVNKDILGSLEYACKVSGSKLILVLGHKSCGAVKAAIEDVKLGNITDLVSKIKPAVVDAHDYKGKKYSKNTEYVNYVAVKNIQLAIKRIKEQSPILHQMEKEGSIKIVGAIYNMHTGLVDFL